MSLTSLEFLDMGQPWPPESQQQRIQRYDENALLFDNRHDEVYGDFVRLLRVDSDSTLEIVLNFHQSLSLLWADMVAGDAPEFDTDVGVDPDAANPNVDTGASVTNTSPDVAAATPQRANRRPIGVAPGRADNTLANAALRDLIKRNRFNILLQELAIDISRFGEAVVRTSRGPDNKSRPRLVPPQFYFPVTSVTDVRDIQYHVLARPFNMQTGVTTDDEGNAVTLYDQYLRVEIHGFVGYVEHRIYKLNGGMIAERIDGATLFDSWQDRTPLPPGVDGPLVVHIPGIRSSDRLHGIDDYRAIDSPIHAIMVRYAQEQRILDKHADPSMAGPPGQIATTTTGVDAYVGGSRYYEVEPGESIIPQYVTWDGNLDASKTHRDDLMREIYRLSETSPAAFDDSTTGAAESGTALRLRLKRSLKKAARIQERIEEPIIRVLTLALALEGVTVEDIRVEWRDGLPRDVIEDTDREIRLVEAGLTSRRSAMRRLFGMADDQIDAELDDMENDGDTATATDPIAEIAAQIGTAGTVTTSTNGGIDETQTPQGEPDSRVRSP